MEPTLIQVLANYGFPALVAFYVLVRIEPTIAELQKTVSTLTVVVAQLGDIDLNEVKKITGQDRNK